MAAQPKHTTPTTRLELPNDRSQIEAARDLIIDAITAAGYPEAAGFAIRLAFEEAVSNAFRHGHRDLDAPVMVEFSVTPQETHIAVEDQGPGFNPEAVPDPTLDENLEQPGGRGLLLMRAYMSEVEYNARGNRVRMVYVNPSARPPKAGRARS